MVFFDMFHESILGYLIISGIFLFVGFSIVSRKNVYVHRIGTLKGKSAVRVGYFVLAVGVGFLIRLVYVLGNSWG